ncbi:MAG: cupin domain-containing protein [Oligoflexus sp.]
MQASSYQAIIEQLKLSPHPEGGYYRETYRSRGSIGESSLPENMLGHRHYSTAIYFLLPKDETSKFHRLKSDELWHFHLGSPVELILLKDNKRCEHVVLGADLQQGQALQYTIPAGTWFAARCLYEPKLGDYSFVSCTVSPGFDFMDFELAGEGLLEDLPDDELYRSLISVTDTASASQL